MNQRHLETGIFAIVLEFLIYGAAEGALLGVGNEGKFGYVLRGVLGVLALLGGAILLFSGPYWVSLIPFFISALFFGMNAYVSNGMHKPD